MLKSGLSRRKTNIMLKVFNYIGEKRTKTGSIVLILAGIIASVFIALNDPIAQNICYHDFSDQHRIFDIPNFWNVVSNFPFLIVGIMGLKNIRSHTHLLQVRIFFAGVSLVAIGSVYYHWEPNNGTLIWDRLPMTIAFMALFSLVISECIQKELGEKLLFPLLLLGISSIVYWVKFDDLRFYALVQFYPLMVIPVLLILLPSTVTPKKGYWLLFLGYLLAKFFETFDLEVHHSLGFISGHSLKHLAAALGIFYFQYHCLKTLEKNSKRQT